MPVIPIINKDIVLIGKDINDKLHEPKQQRNLVLIIVCVALLLDNMLYMVIVPIVPEYLFKLKEGNENSTFSLSTTTHSALINNQQSPITSSMNEINKFPQTTVKFNAGITSINKNNEDEDDDDGSEDVKIGWLFASKAMVQLLINPFSGAFIDRIGYDIPMCIGLSIIFVSTITFAFGDSYAFLFVARGLQGVGSAFADTSGLAMIADRYTEEKERSTALGIALAFISFGSLVAPPFGGILYEHLGKRVPFLSLAFLALIDGLLLFFVMRPHRIAMTLQQDNTHKPKGTPIWRLFMDPYIAICSGALVMANVSLAFLEPTISIWMRKTMNASESEMGYIWLPGFIPHVAGVYFTVWFGRRYPQYQWLLAAIGLALEGLSCFLIPFCKSFGFLMIPISGICFGIALVDTALLPLLGYLVDVRHTSVYGSIYAIADISYSLAYAFGPIMAGGITAKFSFTALNMGICFSNLLYAPVLYLLRSFYQFKPLESTELDALSTPNNNIMPPKGTTTNGKNQQQDNKYQKKVKNQFKDTNNLIDNMEENYEVEEFDEYANRFKSNNYSSNKNNTRGNTGFYESFD